MHSVNKTLVSHVVQRIVCVLLPLCMRSLTRLLCVNGLKLHVLSGLISDLGRLHRLICFNLRMSTPRILRLDEAVVNRIAAGEVSLFINASYDD